MDAISTVRNKSNNWKQRDKQKLQNIKHNRVTICRRGCQLDSTFAASSKNVERDSARTDQVAANLWNVIYRVSTIYFGFARMEQIEL